MYDEPEWEDWWDALPADDLLTEPPPPLTSEITLYLPPNMADDELTCRVQAECPWMSTQEAMHTMLRLCLLVVSPMEGLPFRDLPEVLAPVTLTLPTELADRWTAARDQLPHVYSHVAIFGRLLLRQNFRAVPDALEDLLALMLKRDWVAIAVTGDAPAPHATRFDVIDDGFIEISECPGMSVDDFRTTIDRAAAKCGSRITHRFRLIDANS